MTPCPGSSTLSLKLQCPALPRTTPRWTCWRYFLDPSTPSRAYLGQEYICIYWGRKEKRHYEEEKIFSWPENVWQAIEWYFCYTSDLKKIQTGQTSVSEPKRKLTRLWNTGCWLAELILFRPIALALLWAANPWKQQYIELLSNQAKLIMTGQVSGRCEIARRNIWKPIDNYRRGIWST